MRFVVREIWEMLLKKDTVQFLTLIILQNRQTYRKGLTTIRHLNEIVICRKLQQNYKSKRIR
jgi:hypothetical protein